MRRHLKNTWPVYATLLFCALWWSYDADDWKFPIPTGTANTVAELREQVPLPEYFQDLPEVGPFHWEGPLDGHNAYRVRGKTQNPHLLVNWMWPSAEDLSDEFSRDEEVTLVTRQSSTENGMEVFSDGSFRFSFLTITLGEQD